MITFCVILRINLDFLLLLWVDAAIKFYDFACFGFETTPRVVCFVYSSREWPRLQCPDSENLERKLLQSEEIISTMLFLKHILSFFFYIWIHALLQVIIWHVWNPESDLKRVRSWHSNLLLHLHVRSFSTNELWQKSVLFLNRQYKAL